MELAENEIINAAGCITTEKYLLVNGTSLEAMENLLGFRKGRFSMGVAVGVLVHTPREDQFEFAGYNQVAIDKIDRSTFTKGLDVPRMKKDVIENVFQRERLVKVFPFILHTEGEGYPPGTGIPQWILTEKLPFRIVKVLKNYPADRYSRF